MTIEEAVLTVLNTMNAPEMEIDDLGKVEFTWIVENETEYHFDYYYVLVTAYDENGIIVDDERIHIYNLPPKPKKKVSCRVSGDAKNIQIENAEYYIKENGFERGDKEKHLHDLYELGIFQRTEYNDLCDYLAGKKKMVSNVDVDDIEDNFYVDECSKTVKKERKSSCIVDVYFVDQSNGKILGGVSLLEKNTDGNGYVWMSYRVYRVTENKILFKSKDYEFAIIGDTYKHGEGTIKIRVINGFVNVRFIY